MAVGSTATEVTVDVTVVTVGDSVMVEAVSSVVVVEVLMYEAAVTVTVGVDVGAET